MLQLKVDVPHGVTHQEQLLELAKALVLNYTTALLTRMLLLLLLLLCF
jgi:hypothetical protein